MSEEYPCDWAERLWPDWLARFKPIGVLPRVDFVPADADPTDRFLALLHAMPTPSEFQSTFMPDPIPLSERKPEEGDCDGDLVWAGRKQPGLPYWEWTLDAWLGNDFMASGEEFTHWLPASTKYLPARVDQ